MPESPWRYWVLHRSCLRRIIKSMQWLLIDYQKNLCYVTTDLPTSVVVYQIHVWFHSFPFDARSRDYVLRPTAVPSGGTWDQRTIHFLLPRYRCLTRESRHEGQTSSRASAAFPLGKRDEKKQFSVSFQSPRFVLPCLAQKTSIKYRLVCILYKPPIGYLDQG